MTDTQKIRLKLRQEGDYRLSLSFEDGGKLLCDEPPPLGEGAGPSPVQLLLAASASCLCDSLLFALRKFKQHAEPLGCTAEAELGRNPQGRLRVTGIAVELRLGRRAADLEHLERILGQFENFCTVSQSISNGIPLRLRVLDKDGALLKAT